LWIKYCMNKSIPACITACMNCGLNELLPDWINPWTNCCAIESMVEWTTDWTNCSLNELLAEWIVGWMNCPPNELLPDWNAPWMNSCRMQQGSCGTSRSDFRVFPSNFPQSLIAMVVPTISPLIFCQPATRTTPRPFPCFWHHHQTLFLCFRFTHFPRGFVVAVSRSPPACFRVASLESCSVPPDPIKRAALPIISAFSPIPALAAPPFAPTVPSCQVR
jgi:hypothetical protein